MSPSAVRLPLENDLSLPRLLTKSSPQRPRTAQRPRRHPTGLLILSVAEAGERFGFYLMLTLFALYLNERHGMNEADASRWYGNYLACCYALPFLGGWLAGRVASRRIWVFVGSMVLASGYALLAMDRFVLVPAALAILSVGHGLFKPNISAQVGDLYAPGDRRRDTAFGLFYFAVNVGGLLGPLVGEVLRKVAGWSAAFAAATVALVGSALVLHFGSRHLPRFSVNEVVATSQAPLRRRVAALVLIFAALVPFWMAFHQYGSSLTFYARDCIARDVFWLGKTLEIPPVWFGASNSLFVLVLTGPVVAATRRIASADKLALGLALSSLAFAGLGVASLFQGPRDGSALVLLGYYFVITVGELLLSPVGLSIVSKLSPVRWVGVLFGLWFVSTALGNWLAGKVGQLWATWQHHRFFGLLAASLLVSAVGLASQRSWLRQTLPREEV